MALLEASQFLSSAVVEAVSLVWMELAMLIASALVYVSIVGIPRPSKTKKIMYDDDGPAAGAKEVYRQWQQAKKSGSPMHGGLYAAVTAMRQLHKPSTQILSDLRTVSKKFLPEVEALPAALLRDDALELLPSVLQLLEELGRPADASIHASLMAAQLRRRDLEGVAATAARLSELTPKMRGILAAAAGQQGRLDEALSHLRCMPAAVDGQRCFLSPTAAAHLLNLANREERGPEASEELDRIGARIGAGKATIGTDDFPSDMQRAVSSMKAFAKNKDLASATEVFNRLQAGGVPLRSQIYNCYLDCCVHCEDIEASLKLFDEMKGLKLADVVSYNTVLKAYLSSGRIAEGQDLVKEMSTHGISANKVTYNELLNAKVEAKDRRGMWSVIDEIHKAGLKVNLITCSILLKSLTQNSGESDVHRVMALIDSVDEPMDEVLFSSVIEACIRIRNLDTLASFIQRSAKQGVFKNLAAPVFGAMIKAFGEAGHVKQVRGLWAQMQEHQVKPTSITMGCVVEALVINHCGEEAWQLVQDQLQMEDRKSMINTVVYSTVLKGFAVAKRIDKVMGVYKEMKENNISCNTITYNTMLDACAKCNAMEKASLLLEDMRDTNVEPDIITYSTIIKGYCINGDVERAYSVLEEMKKDAHFQPDEIMYNSILDGCAKQRNVNDALATLEEMTKAGIKPSNYTLSIMVKLLGNARRLGQAIQMVDDLSKQHCLKPNIQVYTCLVHACIQNKRFERALDVYKNMHHDGCPGDEKFYTVLVRGCLQTHMPMKAVDVIRAAYKLPGNLPMSPRAVGVEALEEVCSKIRSYGSEEQQAADALLSELRATGARTEGRRGSGNRGAAVHAGPSRDRRQRETGRGH
mmetsp:Transcript_105684/g.187941  ORF Transcript_105684/g.187941 Transcript_105684/m.187941 type:complete len:866 (-) Transcript_105684:186-2783(-)|eukprot:CAMPEP_0197621982 /NCGR_PEP_ID=MMETSP1338-20131121/2393_1 /TAXON_ID=43686 ORGANISM="Pelagodinium beii, Strain RCC1491" /NCGR_SAMPLE_ID=MMETSP1338 /ASSEMBLY_ACC=CAM_ASM_000754 /LENGTH=865 /DNA_ID=CAMNT_0043191581 /DNA_START=59 /DNA_END=2656 /DNA_ORIENTATION=-